MNSELNADQWIATLQGLAEAQENFAAICGVVQLFAAKHGELRLVSHLDGIVAASRIINEKITTAIEAVVEDDNLRLPDPEKIPDGDD